jgi:hypothetical protein
MRDFAADLRVGRPFFPRPCTRDAKGALIGDDCCEAHIDADGTTAPHLPFAAYLKVRRDVVQQPSFSPASGISKEQIAAA